jgi:hypothetical protein
MINGLADARLKAWSIVAVGTAHGRRFPVYICPVGAIQRGYKSFGAALSGRGNFCTPVPRPMASATMVEAFGLDVRRSASCPKVPSGKKGRNCETNPISFKTCCLPNTNNEKFSLLIKSKSYDSKKSHHSNTRSHQKFVFISVNQEMADGGRAWGPESSHPAIHKSGVQAWRLKVHHVYHVASQAYSQGIRVDWESARRICSAQRNEGRMATESTQAYSR